MIAQVVRNSDGISTIIYNNRYRKWVSLPISQHLRYVNLLAKTGQWCAELMDQVAQGKCSKTKAVAAIQGKFKKLQDEVLNW
jgi:hypothetical protein